MNKIIWTCWFQGEDDPDMPKLNRECIKRWRELNSDWQVNVLSDETIGNYVPEYFDILKGSPERSRPAKSDLLRVLLLSKYGGVWADASVFPMLPLSDFYQNIMNDTGFFTYRYIPRANWRSLGNCETVSWFLCADFPNHPLIESWKTVFIKRFKLQDKFHPFQEWRYLTFHDTLTKLYDTIPHVKFTLDNMVQISEQTPHSAIESWEAREESYIYKRPNLEI
jgi:hypothetical protein